MPWRHNRFARAIETLRLQIVPSNGFVESAFSSYARTGLLSDKIETKILNHNWAVSSDGGISFHYKTDHTNQATLWKALVFCFFISSFKPGFDFIDYGSENRRRKNYAIIWKHALRSLAIHCDSLPSSVTAAIRKWGWLTMARMEMDCNMRRPINNGLIL